MAVAMSSQFSEDGTYFAQITVDGKIKLWNTLHNSFEQEFTPDFHLTSPCTCLHFQPVKSGTRKTSPSPKKKKRRQSDSSASPNIVLGTTCGILLVYSISKAEVDFVINSDIQQPISCLSSTDSRFFYSGADQNICQWDLDKRSLSSKWKSGGEKICSILVIPDSDTILTASKNIKLWNVDNQQVVRTFTGHSSDVMFLHYVNPRDTGDAYVLSGSKGDRLLNVWSLNGNNRAKQAVASFLMEDVVQNVSINIANDDSTHIAATVRSGVVHVYQQKLNGKSNTPIKPVTTVQVVSDTGQNGDLVMPLRVIGAIYKDEEMLCIGYGSEVLLTFENIKLCTYSKIQCLVRTDPRSATTTRQDQISKTQTPIISNNVHYVSQQNASATPARKRRNEGDLEVPMERRLENLTLNRLDGTSKVPKADNVAQLLVQGLHSKDRNILRTALCKREDSVIRNTVSRLPVTVLEPLVAELTKFIQGKTLSSQIGSLWLKHISHVHAGILMSNPNLSDLLGPALGSIDSRISLQTPLNRLRGKLDLLLPQVKLAEDDDQNEEAALIFNDKDSSDSDVENIQFDVDSESEIDNEWDEDINEEVTNENDDSSSDGSEEVIMLSQ